MISIKINNKKHEYKKGISAIEIAKEHNNDALAVKINGELKDLSTEICEDSDLEFVTFNDKEGVEVFRHSTAHLLAHAVQELFPGALNTIGPSVDEGFYYDFDTEPFTPEDLTKIQKKMHELMKKKLPFERIEITKKEAKEMFKDNKYKLELLEDFEENISAYKDGDFLDLCRGPHVPDTGYLKAFKLMKIAGAYWKGDAKNKQLQRIYGVSFPDKDQLKEYLNLLEEAKKRDHKKIGKEMELFSMHEESPGCAFLLSNGMTLLNNLIEYWRDEHKKEGYQEIRTPIILNRSLWETSGHWENYRENMYTTKIDGQDNAIKPMNCPGGLLVYKEKSHSYREFPLKVGELGLVHRHELSGTLNGLFRVRVFTQDDAHIFMTKKQIRQEILSLMSLYDRFYSLFGFTYHVELSTRPEKSVGDDKMWELAESELKAALDDAGREYIINEGDGAFYGPKIDFHLKDAIGRTWQCGTIQLDMNLPDRFDLTYVDEDGSKKRPVMIHRVVYGSLERFMGLLIEHYAGKFPLWLSPVQVKILTVADRFDDYANRVKDELERVGLRVEVDSRSESINYKVRQAQLSKCNYILVVGEKEIADETVTVRTRNNEILGAMKIAEFAEKLVKEVEEKK